MDLDTARKELIDACATFKRVAHKALHTITTGEYSVFGTNRLYISLSGAATYEACPKEFKAFCECLYDIESATEPYSPLTKGVLFKHKMHALEYHHLKLNGGRLDLNDVLEFNINNNPVLVRICTVVKEALKESGVIEKLRNYKHLEKPTPTSKPKQMSGAEVTASISKLPKPTALSAKNDTPPQDFGI